MKGECRGSRTWASKTSMGRDGQLHCPVCDAVVGATAASKIKVHKPGVPTRVITGGGRMGNYQ